MVVIAVSAVVAYYGRCALETLGRHCGQRNWRPALLGESLTVVYSLIQLSSQSVDGIFES